MVHHTTSKVTHAQMEDVQPLDGFNGSGKTIMESKKHLCSLIKFALCAWSLTLLLCDLHRPGWGGRGGPQPGFHHALEHTAKTDCADLCPVSVSPLFIDYKKLLTH